MLRSESRTRGFVVSLITAVIVVRSADASLPTNPVDDGYDNLPLNQVGFSYSTLLMRGPTIAESCGRMGYLNANHSITMRWRRKEACDWKCTSLVKSRRYAL